MKILLQKTTILEFSLNKNPNRLLKALTTCGWMEWFYWVWVVSMELDFGSLV